MKDYQFKSRVTLGLLPFGVTRLSEVDRHNVSDLMREIITAANNRNWIRMVLNKVVQPDLHWEVETLVQYVDDVKSDLIALKGKLKS